MRDVSTLLEQRRSVFTDNYTVISSQAVYETRLIEGERGSGGGFSFARSCIGATLLAQQLNDILRLMI